MFSELLGPDSFITGLRLLLRPRTWLHWQRPVQRRQLTRGFGHGSGSILNTRNRGKCWNRKAVIRELLNILTVVRVPRTPLYDPLFVVPAMLSIALLLSGAVHLSACDHAPVQPDQRRGVSRSERRTPLARAAAAVQPQASVSVCCIRLSISRCLCVIMGSSSLPT